MTTEDIFRFLGEPGASEAFVIGLSFAVGFLFVAVICLSVFALLLALICRYIWPGKKMT